MESEPDECAGTVSKRSRLGAADHGFCPCSSAEEQPASNRKAGGATPPRDTMFHVPVAQQQSSRSITGRSKVRILPGIPIFMFSSGSPISRGIRLKTGQLRVQVPPGGP